MWVRGELEVGNITTIRGNLTVYGTTPLGLYPLPSLVVAATIAAHCAAFCSSTTSRLSTAPAPGSQVPKLPREPSPVSKLPTNHPLSLIVHTQVMCSRIAMGTDGSRGTSTATSTSRTRAPSMRHGGRVATGEVTWCHSPALRRMDSLMILCTGPRKPWTR